MALTQGTRLGPYEVVGHLGSGGMGEVYGVVVYQRLHSVPNERSVRRRRYRCRRRVCSGAVNL